MGRTVAIIVCGDAERSRGLATLVRACDLEPLICRGLVEARAALTQREAELIFCDAEHADRETRLFLNRIHCMSSQPRVIVTSRQMGCQACLQLMRLGAFDVMWWPCPAAEAERIIRNALAEKVLTAKAS